MFQPQLFRFGSLMDQWSDLQRLRRGMDRFLSAAPFGENFPAINVWIGQENAILTTELPGIDPAQLDISVVNDVLKISGARESEKIKEGESFYRQERSSGPFTRAVQLPFMIDAAKVEAFYEKGILKIILPRAEAEKPKRIMINKA